MVCGERGGDPAQPRRCQVQWRLAAVNCGAAVFDSTITNQPGLWLERRGPREGSTTRRCDEVEQVAADRRSRAWGGAAGHGEEGSHATRSRWTLGAHGRAGSAHDFYLLVRVPIRRQY